MLIVAVMNNPSTYLVIIFFRTQGIEESRLLLRLSGTQEKEREENGQERNFPLLRVN
jgi:hypothetical protein